MTTINTEYYMNENRKLKEWKDDIKQLVENYVSSDTSDENVYKVLERLCINHMLDKGI